MSSEKKSTQAQRLSFDPRAEHPFDLNHVLNELGGSLVRQGPVKDFIHQHPLHEFQKNTFEDGIWQASRMYGAFAFLPPSFYQQAYREGRLAKAELERVFQLRGTPPALREQALRRLEAAVDEPGRQPPRGFVHEGIRAAWRRVHKVDVDTLGTPLLFRLLGAYLDQGIASRRFPECADFFSGVRHLVEHSYLPLAPLSDPMVRDLLKEPPETVILHCLETLVGDSTLYERYLHEVILAHPGWYAMAHQIKVFPNALTIPKKIDVGQVLAVELLIEVGLLLREYPEGFAPVGQTLTRGVAPAPYSHVDECLPLWHEAFEWTHHAEFLKALQVQSADRRGNLSPVSAQAFFCIDDRETSLRTYLEELDPHLQTFSSAGFFGIDFYYQGIHDSRPVKQCPLPVTPKFVVRDLPLDRPTRKVRPDHAFHLNTRSNTLIRGWLTAQVIGLWSAIKLVLSIVKPTLSQPSLSALQRIEPAHEFHLYRNGDQKTAEGLYVGYSVEEMATRVEGVLRSSGITRDFAPVVVMYAHGSSSTNNPHFAAYDCGACSGRAGAPNARAFAIMANDPQVRAILLDRGIAIPATTRFVGAIHDTTRDEVRYFDTGDVMGAAKTALEGLQVVMEEALKLNAKERCRRFELVPLDLTPEKALAEVKKRSSALFEPRPEMNHATNSMTIVGRRSLTYEMFLDRRPFLQSYDPTTDPQGETLQALLGALIPVCGGINLEYFFSRLDNEVFGAGTKLPHNIVSLLSVANGVEGDIRCGLPAQMVEIHDPIRLMLVIEQEPEIALAALQREPALYEWVANGWCRYAALSPTTHQVFIVDSGKMLPVELSHVAAPPIAKNSAAVLEKAGRENLAVHRLGVKRGW